MSSYDEKSINTFVSTFIDLSRREKNDGRHNGDFYTKYGKTLLEQDIHLYLFLEEDMMDSVKKYREKLGFASKTYIEAITFELLPAYAYFPKIQECRNKNPCGNGKKDTPSYICLIDSKVGLVKQAIEKNPFQSTHFAWIDFGIFHVAKQDYLKIDKTFKTLSEKIKLNWMESFPWGQNVIERYKKIEGLVAGGFMTGNIENWNIFHTMFYHELKKAFCMGYAPSEEQLFPHLIEKNFDFFDVYFGTYETILSNYQKQRIGFNALSRRLHWGIQDSNQAFMKTLGMRLLTTLENGEQDVSLNGNFLYGILLNIWKIFRNHCNCRFKQPNLDTYKTNCEICKRVVKCYDQYMKTYPFLKSRRPIQFQTISFK